MDDLLLMLMPIVFIVFYLFSPKHLNKKCPNCNKYEMYSNMYIGDGDGPAPDHIIATCRNCEYTEEILLP